jgi:membrane protein DedA with SNARE-associated domain
VLVQRRKVRATEWIEKITTKFKVSRGIVAQLRRDVTKYAPRLIFLSKLTVGFPIPALIAVGLERVSVKRWILQLVLGEVIKSAVLLSVGALCATGIEHTYGPVRIVLWSITGVIALAGIIYFRAHKKEYPNE